MLILILACVIALLIPVISFWAFCVTSDRGRREIEEIGEMLKEREYEYEHDWKKWIEHEINPLHLLPKVRYTSDCSFITPNTWTEIKSSRTVQKFRRDISLRSIPRYCKRLKGMNI